MEILIILLLIFVIWPIVKIGWRVRQVRHEIYKAQQQYQQQSQQGQSQKRRGDDNYNPDEGEYVEFEEITSSTVTEQTSANDETYYHESQISDAEYEEIKD